jgi:hypothetical protein
MRENRTYGSEGGEAKAFPTPIAESPVTAVDESDFVTGFAAQPLEIMRPLPELQPASDDRETGAADDTERPDLDARAGHRERAHPRVGR